jgi:UDP-N-acetylglucosamine transferase subunit ALG13
MKTLLVCSGGGHLKQLFTLTRRLGIPAEDQHWVTFANGLSRSLLEDRDVTFVPFAAPRDAVNIARIAIRARRLLGEVDIDRAISTGSSPAVAFLPLAARRGIDTHYIESAARASGPSLSGKIIARFPEIATYTQYPGWADGRWNFGGSIFDEFEAVAEKPRPGGIRKVVVSVGTQDGYQFDRLYRSLAPLLAGKEVLWQTGPQDVTRFGIRDARASVPHAELQTAVREADLVVAHAGTGAALTAIEADKCPVLVPRRSQFREHVDDHQLQIAGELSRRGLAIAREADALDENVLELAAGRATRRVEPAPFLLSPRASGATQVA